MTARVGTRLRATRIGAYHAKVDPVCALWLWLRICETSLRLLPELRTPVTSTFFLEGARRSVLLTYEICMTVTLSASIIINSRPFGWLVGWLATRSPATNLATTAMRAWHAAAAAISSDSGSRPRPCPHPSVSIRLNKTTTANPGFLPS